MAGPAHSAHQPLLENGFEVKETPFWVSSVKWVLKIVMWVVLVSWLAFIFFYPTQIGRELSEKWNHFTGGTVFGRAGWLS